MRIETIIIGNEIVNGKISDTNSKWLATFLGSKGLSITCITILPDHEDELTTQIQNIFNRSDLVVVTGGLGPTPDDITLPSIAQALNKKLEKDAYLPQDFIAINNNVGTAEGALLWEDNKMLIAAPGVPDEFQTMFAQEAFPIIVQKFNLKNEFKSTVDIRTKFIGESKLLEIMNKEGVWQQLAELGEPYSLPHPMSVDIGVYLQTKTLQELQVKEEKIKEIINNSSISQHIWQIGELSLEELIVKRAVEKSLTFTFAESCTGGLCASRITDVSGSSEVFYGSIVSYSNEVKESSLSVKHETLKANGAVSIETAQEMAIGALETMPAQIAISLSGIAGPLGATTGKPVGTVCVGFANKKGETDSWRFGVIGDRAKNKYQFSQIGLFKLLEAIERY